MGRGKGKARKRDKDNHHYLFPKKLYRGENRIIRLSYDFHHNFHNYFMGNCKFPPRNCSGCAYAIICCYEGTNIPFGRRVQ